MYGPKPQQLVLFQSFLDQVPNCPPPEGFRFDWHKEGDEARWLDIHRAAERAIPITHELYLRQFGLDQRVIHDRQLFLLNEEDEAVGTATAWFDAGYLARLTGRKEDIYADLNYGRVHWVAVRPEFQGRGLGTSLVTAVCQRLRDLGHQRAYLVTWSDRPKAIRMYSRLGFVEAA